MGCGQIKQTIFDAINLLGDVYDLVMNKIRPRLR